jgi:hypothetical protein
LLLYCLHILLLSRRFSLKTFLELLYSICGLRIMAWTCY